MSLIKYIPVICLVVIDLSFYLKIVGQIQLNHRLFYSLYDMSVRLEGGEKRNPVVSWSEYGK